MYTSAKISFSKEILIIYDDDILKQLKIQKFEKKKYQPTSFHGTTRGYTLFNQLSRCMCRYHVFIKSFMQIDSFRIFLGDNQSKESNDRFQKISWQVSFICPIYSYMSFWLFQVVSQQQPLLTAITSPNPSSSKARKVRIYIVH